MLTMNISSSASELCSDNILDLATKCVSKDFPVLLQYDKTNKIFKMTHMETGLFGHQALATHLT